MKTVSGQLKRLGEHDYEEHGKTYSVIEIGDEHLTKVFVPKSLDMYLTTCQGRECTLYLNRGRFLFAVNENGRTHALKVGVGLPLVHMLITGFFGFLFLLGFLANVWDGMYTRGGAGLNFMGAMFFAALAFFSLRAFLRSLRVFRDGAKVRALPGAVLL
tara:strand:+ start:3167 stop:3643 length:477 start_codon:yes stop_codon:yes gene_type:complete